MTQESILYNHSAHTPCKDIFNALCEEVGNHYSNLGLKYTKSKRSITKEADLSKTVIAFHSSRSNIPGEWVAVEIGVSIYVKIEDQFGKIPVFGSTSMFSYKLDSEQKGHIVVEKIFGEKFERIEEHKESELKISNNFNAYDFTPEKFQILIEFIDQKVLKFSEKIFDPEFIKEYIENAGSMRKWSMRQDTFKEFLEHYFASQQFEKLLPT